MCIQMYRVVRFGSGKRSYLRTQTYRDSPFLCEILFSYSQKVTVYHLGAIFFIGVKKRYVSSFLSVENAPIWNL